MARPKLKSKGVPWKHDDQCPCDSGLNFGNCCACNGEAPLIQTPSLLPPGKISGHEHPKCYLRFTKNCCTKISREHYISESVLSQFDGLKVGGMPWQNPGEENKYSLNNLTSKILCRRHNTALSPLDTAANHFFKKIFKAGLHVTKKSVSSRPEYFLVSGEALELWALKTLLGLFYSKISQSSGMTMFGEYRFDNNIVNEAFFGQGIKDPKGIYVKAEIGDLFERNLKFRPLSASAQKILSGLVVKVNGFEMEFLFDLRYARQEFFIEHRPYYRPGVIDIFGKKRASRIYLSWQGQQGRVNQFSIDIKAVAPPGSA